VPELGKNFMVMYENGLSYFKTQPCPENKRIDLLRIPDLNKHVQVIKVLDANILVQLSDCCLFFDIHSFLLVNQRKCEKTRVMTRPHLGSQYFQVKNGERKVILKNNIQGDHKEVWTDHLGTLGKIRKKLDEEMKIDDPKLGIP